MRKKIYGEVYRGYPLRKCEIDEKNEGFYQEPLDRINDLLCCCRENYKKVFFVWFVLKFPKESRFAKRNDNEVFCKFIEELRRSYMSKCPRRKFHPDGREIIPLPLYIWARELSDSGQYHYHVTIVLDGQIAQDPQKVFYRARDLWANFINRAARLEDKKLGRCSDNTEYFAPFRISMDFGSNDYRDTKCGRLSPFRKGGYRIFHYMRQEQVIAHYDAMFEFLSYYAKIYSKPCHEELIQGIAKDPRKKPKNFGCSQIPRYTETVRDIELRVRPNEGE
jgi:hypothetical protein